MLFLITEKKELFPFDFYMQRMFMQRHMINISKVHRIHCNNIYRTFLRKPVSAARCYFLSRENEKLSRENEKLSRENEKLSRKNEHFVVKTNFFWSLKRKYLSSKRS